MKKTKVPITWKSGEANQPERPPRVVAEFGTRGPYARVYRIVEEWNPEDGSLLSTLECSRPDSMGADSWRTVRGKSRRWDPLVQALKALVVAAELQALAVALDHGDETPEDEEEGEPS